MPFKNRSPCHFHQRTQYNLVEKEFYSSQSKKKKEKSLKFISVNRKVEKRIRLSLSKTYYKADLVFFQIVIT